MLHLSKPQQSPRLIHTLKLTKAFQQISSSSTSVNMHETNFAKYSLSKLKETTPQRVGLHKYSNRQTQKFRKRINKIEANKENIFKGTFSRIQKSIKNIKLEQTQRISTLTKDRFHPRKLADFQLKQEADHPRNNELNPLILQGVLQRNRMKDERSLFGYNIPSLQHKYNFSRFELHNLHSIYQVLLHYSKGSISKFQAGFEVMLNMNRISVRMDVIRQIFEELERLDFSEFVGMYSKIDSLIFRQNIIDYLDILFENIRDRDNIRYEDVLKVFRGRVTEGEAHELSHFIFEKTDRSEDASLTLKEMYRLCHTCEQFTKKMFKLYTKQIKCD